MSEPAPFPSAPGRALPQRTQRLLIAIAAAVIAAGFAVAWFIAHRHAPEPAPPAVSPGTFKPSKTQWETLKTTRVEALAFATRVVADGSIAYNDDATTPVFSPYSGRVTKLIAKPGDFVKQGTPLLAVDASEFAQGQSDLGTAHAQLAQAEANEHRQHALYEAKAGALKDWLQTQTDLTAARNALNAARNRLRILGKSDVEINALEASAAKPAGNAETYVLAPISGTVTQRQVGLGQYIAAGASNPVFAIGNLSSAWLIANVRESDAPLMHVGDTVEVRLLAYPGRTFNAKLTWVAPALDVNTHRLPVRAQVDNHEGLLKPLMFASFGIQAGGETTSPAVPKSAIVYEGADARVYVARDDGTVASRQIRTGRSIGDMVEVTDGLTAGEKVISGGTLFIDRATDAGGA
jgi:cobalt-zinc-cadmium efflux system membrane fusion protein